MNSEPDKTRTFKQHHPDYRAYADDITAEIQMFGANAFADVFRRGEGIHYKKIVRNVAKHLDIKRASDDTIGVLEEHISTVIMQREFGHMFRCFALCPNLQPKNSLITSVLQIRGL
jgi:uncharacterized protein YaaW (UPF0174 family)